MQDTTPRLVWLDTRDGAYTLNHRFVIDTLPNGLYRLFSRETTMSSVHPTMGAAQQAAADTARRLS